MHGLSENEAKGWQALDFHEASGIPEVKMQHDVVSDTIIIIISSPAKFMP
jgi:hypothetical protein